MSTLLDTVSNVINNPSLIQQTILQRMKEQLGNENYDITSASNPFMMLTETSVLNTSAIVREEEAILRRLYSSMAMSEEELYCHMSDRDYVGRFATPVTNNFYILLSIEEIKAKAKATSVSGISKLVIPRFTSVKVGDLTYTMQYPINIRVMRHGGLQITYDNDVTSPIQTLTSNMVSWETVTIERIEYVRMKVPIQQFVLTSHTLPINNTSAVNATFTFDDQFYYCRIYNTTDGVNWTEVRTTHSDQVFDPKVPTVVLKKIDSTLNVRIPITYTSSSEISGTLRIDVYTSKGKLSTSMESYGLDAFTWSFNGMGDDDTYSAPLNSMSYIFIYSDEVVSGGKNGKTFLELRDAVVNDTLTRVDSPISNLQLRTSLENKGFDIVTAVDTVTDRQFLATRQLDAPSNGILVSSMGTYMGTLQSSYDALVKHPSIVSNGNRLTITPNTLFEIDNGVISVVNDADVQGMKTMGTDALVREINNRRFLYTPFYYVLDINNDAFDVRAYALDAPAIQYKSLVDANDSSLMQAYIKDYHISKSADGYLLTFTATGDDTFNKLDAGNVVAQVSYQPRNETSWAACNATYLGVKDNVRYYQVEFKTKHDLDSYNRLHTTNFSMFSDIQTNYGIALEDNIDITFVIRNQDMTEYLPTTLDRKIQTHLLTSETGYMCVTCERLHIKFGSVLDSLWRQHRSVITSKDYETYDSDVPYVREDTVYERDEFGNVVVTTDANGKPSFKVKYEKGSIIKDDAGNPIIRYRNGNLKRDSQGNLILRNERGIAREFTLMFTDGMFYFVTDSEALSYRSETTATLMSWVDTLDGLESSLLEKSELYLFPTQTMGDVKVLVLDGQTTSISIAQNFAIEFFMSDVGFRDTQLREAVVATTKKLIVEQLNQRTVSISSITTALKEALGDAVISITVSGLGGSLNLSTITMKDDTARLSLAKRLVVKSNSTLAVEDSIDVTFIRHSLLT